MVANIVAAMLIIETTQTILFYNFSDGLAQYRLQSLRPRTRYSSPGKITNSSELHTGPDGCWNTDNLLTMCRIEKCVELYLRFPYVFVVWCVMEHIHI